MQPRKFPAYYRSFLQPYNFPPQTICNICTVAIIVEHDNNQCNLSFRVRSHGNMIIISVIYHLEYVAMVT